MKDYSDIINFLVLDYKVKNKRKNVFDVKFYEQEDDLIILLCSSYKYKEVKVEFSYFKFSNKEKKFYMNTNKNPVPETLIFNKEYTNYAEAEDE